VTSFKLFICLMPRLLVPNAEPGEGFKIFICFMSRKTCNPELSTEAGLRAQLGEAFHGHDGRLGSGRSGYRLRGRLWR
jgi:hypothetical protein